MKLRCTLLQAAPNPTTDARAPFPRRLQGHMPAFMSGATQHFSTIPAILSSSGNNGWQPTTRCPRHPKDPRRPSTRHPPSPLTFCLIPHAFIIPQTARSNPPPQPVHLPCTRQLREPWIRCLVIHYVLHMAPIRMTTLLPARTFEQMLRNYCAPAAKLLRNTARSLLAPESPKPRRQSHV